MEVGLSPDIPTYSGGLGMLAGDTLRAAADIGFPMVGVTLLHRKGYFRQSLDAGGNQTESFREWSPEEVMKEIPGTVTVLIEGRPVQVRAWLYSVKGLNNQIVPVYLLDTDLPENTPEDRRITDNLYGGDGSYRLAQEIVLGVGGVSMLRAAGHRRFGAYHMNEGHSSLLALALLDETGEGPLAGAPVSERIDLVRQQCVFTTHTPVPAGHDAFPLDMARGMLPDRLARYLDDVECCLDGTLNLTYLALYFSHYINGVSLRHGTISQDMFPSYPINGVTNGVHAETWTSKPIQDLLDRHLPEWRYDNRYLRYAVGVPLEEIQNAHVLSKELLIEEVRRRTGRELSRSALTLGFARRATPYKRSGLLLSDLERLRHIARKVGPLQILYAGKAHPRDEAGKDLIRQVFRAAESLGGDVPVIYLEEYDMTLGRFLCSGVDLWINTPQKPQEASGTSGMKAAVNGVPSLSVLDGWWLEGHVEGVTGWSIGDTWEQESAPREEAESLYDKLEYLIAPMFYDRPLEYARVMRSAIALNGSFFNAQRMLSQYVRNAYRSGK